MKIQVDGEILEVPSHLEKLPCGGTPVFDKDSSIYSYRCDLCFSVVPSMGMPSECRKLYDEQRQVT